MDLTDYIYVIIGVLWFLFSIIGGAVKAKNKAAKALQKPVSKNDTTIPDEPADDVRQMLEDLMQGKSIDLKKRAPKPISSVVKKPVFVEKREPSKMEVHKEHQSFMIDERKKKKKSLQNQKDDLSSYSESFPSTTSHHQHPPDVVPAEPVSEIALFLKDVSTQKHPILVDFDAQKAFLFSEIFNRRNY